MANVTNYQKHGYFHGIKALPPESAMKIFCQRRASAIVKAFGYSLRYDEMLAKVYFQGLQDGKDIWSDTSPAEDKS
jgi:hypothetical protein